MYKIITEKDYVSIIIWLYKKKIIELIEKIEKKKNEEKFYFNDNEKQKKQLREVNKLIKELIEKLKKD